MRPQTAAVLGLILLAYAVYGWLTYIAKYERSRVETVARLILNGADRRRSRLMAEEGISDG